MWFNLNFLVVCHIFALIWTFCVILPIEIRAVYQMYHDWIDKKAYIMKRRPVLIYGCVLSVSLIQFGFIPLVSIQYLNRHWNNSNATSTPCNSFLRIILSVFPIIFAGALLTIRVWLLYFDINLSKYYLHKAWSSAITSPNSTSNDNNKSMQNEMQLNVNWFYKHQKTLGNVKYLTVVTFIIIIICFLIDVYIYVEINLVGASLFSICCYGLTFIACGIFYYKLKNCYFDELAIRKEFVISIMSLLPRYVCFIINSIVSLNVDRYTEIEYCLTHQYLSIYVCSTGIIILTMYGKYKTQPNYKYIYSNKKDDKSKYKCNNCNICQIYFHPISRKNHIGIDQKSGIDTVEQSGRSRSRSESDGIRRIGSRWSDIVCSQLGYESLMNHLVCFV